MNAPPIDNKLRHLKLYYATAASNERYQLIPVPTIVLFINDKRLMPQSYEAYLTNRMATPTTHPAAPSLSPSAPAPAGNGFRRRKPDFSGNRNFRLTNSLSIVPLNP